ncbi:hypothetical protein SAMN04489747_2484 [Auraticoccus monumenti]|uniref:Uncharacterized protein n=2 Tax=Auraticoccus monumenti TaxID=675864 RepID=A0A1G7A2P9_9ACTN|nr:hypothetical protein SAMN04489747_2484 [Auraticoccus monumenti]
MDYLKAPSSSVERYRRRDMEQRFLMRRSIEQQPPRLPNGRRVLRMFCDYGRVHPLWESFTDHYTASPEDFELSVELGEALQRWAQGWQVTDEERWLIQGDELADRIDREVGHDVQVRREYRMNWSLDGANPQT